jgi:biopolymer transport protein ExbD
MKTKQSSANSEVLAEINITPFTDVLLVLLIIFMILAALIVPPGFERALANPSGAPQPITVANSVPVVIDSNQHIRVDGVETTAQGLYPAMERLAQRNRPPRVTLYADTRAHYGLIIRVLDAAKAAGVHDVSFVTE